MRREISKKMRLAFMVKKSMMMTLEDLLKRLNLSIRYPAEKTKITMKVARGTTKP